MHFFSEPVFGPGIAEGTFIVKIITIGGGVDSGAENMKAEPS